MSRHGLFVAVKDVAVRKIHHRAHYISFAQIDDKYNLKSVWRLGRQNTSHRLNDEKCTHTPYTAYTAYTAHTVSMPTKAKRHSLFSFETAFAIFFGLCECLYIFFGCVLLLPSCCSTSLNVKRNEGGVREPRKA